MIRITAHLAGAEQAPVTVEHSTLPGACCRAAVHFAGGSPGSGGKRERAGRDRWVQSWSRLPAALHVRRIPPSGPSGERRGHLVRAWISEEAHARLEILAHERGSVRAAIEAAILGQRDAK